MALPNFQPIVTENLGGEVIVRSLLLVSLENVDYLMCGLGDGLFFSFVLDASGKSIVLTQKRKISLGTQPILLR